MIYDLVAPGIVGCIILGILIGQHVVPSNGSALKLTLIILTNTCYELFLVFLLGYALVEYPRSLWIKGDLDYYLLKLQMKAAAEFKQISDAQLNVSLVVADVIKTRTQLANYADPSLIQAIDILSSGNPPSATLIQTRF